MVYFSFVSVSLGIIHFDRDFEYVIRCLHRLYLLAICQVYDVFLSMDF